MLAVTGLQAFHGPAQALFDVSFDAARGEVLALLGRNGAGKSTLLKSIIGLVPAKAGEIALDGRDLSGLAPHRRAAAGIGYVPEDRRVFKGLSVRENLAVATRLPRAGAPAWDEPRVVALFPKLAELRDRRGGQLSGGEQQMLTIGRALMGNPLVLLLDEPSTGLAPRIVEGLAEAVSAMKSAGMTVLLSEQNLAFAAAVADAAVVLETGHVRWRGSMAHFLKDAELARTHLEV
ncbi:MAG: ABC transporter ATP-binding protein [Rhodospirillales bacterium]|nr:MAG: ABC transporter ATP-binding protein [Rhodospirillales bacterium]